MPNSNGKLSWGACINTTGNRVCDPQGQFNREGAEFETVTYANLVLGALGRYPDPEARLRVDGAPRPTH